MKTYRYPGTQPFSTHQESLFFGREEDTIRLYRLIKTENLVVLYGKSGMGKSSLLHAGIVPKVLLDQQYIPLFVRFNAWSEGKDDNPVHITLQTLSRDGSDTTVLDTLVLNEKSMWHKLKEKQFAAEGPKKYLLIFDQFEELFTYPPDAILEFKEQLSEALHSRIPQRYRLILESQLEQGICRFSDRDFDLLNESTQLKVVISVRSDRLHLMDRLSDSVPEILSHCYELGFMNSDQAGMAITQPAGISGDFLSPPFEYSPEATQRIVAFLDDEEHRIETIQLQILCRNFEEQVVQTGIRKIEVENLGDLREVISNFYKTQINQISNRDINARVRLLIEEGLIAAEDRQRLSLHEAQILSLFQVRPEHLKALVDGGLLRAEPALRGGYAYELSHDTLVQPALEARTERRITEVTALREKVEAEAIAALKEERRKRHNARRIAIVMSFLTLLSMTGGISAFWQTQKARKAEELANKNKEEAILQKNLAEENNLKAFVNEQYALSEKARTEVALEEAEEAERLAMALVAKGKTLESNLSSTDTYQFLMQEGFLSLGAGNYRGALTYFATARFVSETSDAERALKAAKTGLAAEKLFHWGDLERAKTLFAGLTQQYPSHSGRAAMRIKQADWALQSFQKAIGNRPPETILELSLKAEKLAALPSAIAQLVHLQSLDLSNNADLTELPPAIGQLTHLVRFKMTDSGLRSLPESIGRLESLESLDLQNNANLQALPVSLAQLPHLSILNLADCRLAQLPEQFGRLGHLKFLNLEGNPLEQLPESLAGLKGIAELNLSGLPYLKWPQSLPVVARLSSLESLNLSRNNALDPDVLGVLRALPHLETLQVQFNGYSPSDKERIRALLPKTTVNF